MPRFRKLMKSLSPAGSLPSTVCEIIRGNSSQEGLANPLKYFRVQKLFRVKLMKEEHTAVTQAVVLVTPVASNQPIKPCKMCNHS